jgi:hypothetical protein
MFQKSKTFKCQCGIKSQKFCIWPHMAVKIPVHNEEFFRILDGQKTCPVYFISIYVFYRFPYESILTMSNKMACVQARYTYDRFSMLISFLLLWQKPIRNNWKFYSNMMEKVWQSRAFTSWQPGSGEQERMSAWAFFFYSIMPIGWCHTHWDLSSSLN